MDDATLRVGRRWYFIGGSKKDLIHLGGHGGDRPRGGAHIERWPIAAFGASPEGGRFLAREIEVPMLLIWVRMPFRRCWRKFWRRGSGNRWRIGYFSCDRPAVRLTSELPDGTSRARRIRGAAIRPRRCRKRWIVGRPSAVVDEPARRTVERKVPKRVHTEWVRVPASEIVRHAPLAQSFSQGMLVSLPGGV
jgi:hypothetical protein